MSPKHPHHHSHAHPNPNPKVAPEAHVMDYPALDLGMSTMSVHTICLVDLDVHVYGLDEIRGSTLPIGAIISSHGRCNSAKNMGPMSRGIIAEINRLQASGGRTKTRDVIICTLDARNHGTRTKHRTTNLAYDKNPHHFVDMAATIYGASQDYSMIINFLAAYLFPNGERVIDEFFATGISLGGNSVWRMLREDPRIRIAVPIIGLPFDAFAPYLGARAESLGLEFKPPTYPPSLVPYLNTPEPKDAYKGKKILAIHGELDELVPYRFGKETIARIQAEAPAGDVEVYVQEQRGHVCTPEMVRKTAEWFWRWGLSQDK